MCVLSPPFCGLCACALYDSRPYSVSAPSFKWGGTPTERLEPWDPWLCFMVRWLSFTGLLPLVCPRDEIGLLYCISLELLFLLLFRKSKWSLYFGIVCKPSQFQHWDAICPWATSGVAFVIRSMMENVTGYISIRVNWCYFKLNVMEGCNCLLSHYL